MKNKQAETYYRGESKDNGETACLPFMFREFQGIEFEKNYYYSLISRLSELAVIKEVTHEDEKGYCTLLKQLGVLQHYGFKTRLLDITRRYDIARYFASSGNFNKDGYVYIFKDEQLREIDSEYAKTIERKMMCIAFADWYKYKSVREGLCEGNSHLSTITRSIIVDHKIVSKSLNTKMNDNIRLKKQEGSFILFGFELDQDNKLKDNYPVVKYNHKSKITADEKLGVLMGLVQAEKPICFTVLFPDSDESLKLMGKYEELCIMNRKHTDCTESIREFARRRYENEEIVSLFSDVFLDSACSLAETILCSQEWFCFIFKELRDYALNVQDLQRIKISFEDVANRLGNIKS